MHEQLDVEKTKRRMDSRSNLYLRS